MLDLLGLRIFEADAVDISDLLLHSLYARCLVR